MENSLPFALKEKAYLELNETSENLTNGIVKLRKLIENEPNLRSRTDTQFLLKFLRARKFDTSRAFELLKQYYAVRINNSTLFSNLLPSKHLKLLEMGAQATLNERDENGSKFYIFRLGVRFNIRVYEFENKHILDGNHFITNSSKNSHIDIFIIKKENFNMKNESTYYLAVRQIDGNKKCDMNVISVEDIFKTNLMALELLSLEQATQISGVIALIDLKGFTIKQHLKLLSPYFAKWSINLIQESFPLRFSAFHVINQPIYFDAIFATIKPFMKRKLRKRIHFHGGNMASLYERVNRNLLPMEYGGNQTLNTTEWKNRLLSEEKLFKEMEEYGYKCL